MNILITNDDGIGSDGLRRLAEAALGFGEVVVVAPGEQCSAQSHSITLRHSITVHPVSFPVQGVRAFSCSGTPGDCVRIGSLNIMKKKPDLLLSGINYGYNLASDIQYSATVGAAFEAEFQGFNAIAFSEDAADVHEVTDAFLLPVLEEVIHSEYVPGEVVNVNFPGCPLKDLKGIKRDVRVSRLPYYTDQYLEDERLPDGGVRYTVKGVHTPFSEVDTDYAAVLDNYISIGRVKNIS